MIGMLFKVERSIATAPRKKRERSRRKHSKPVVERFFAWCEDEWPNFLDDGRLPLDNNLSEREFRRQAVGRKNWILVGSDDGARANSADSCSTRRDDLVNHAVR
jgi:transposase